MSGQPNNELYLVNGGVYLHLVDNVEQFDYTLYDRAC